MRVNAPRLTARASTLAYLRDSDSPQGRRCSSTPASRRSRPEAALVGLPRDLVPITLLCRCSMAVHGRPTGGGQSEGGRRGPRQAPGAGCRGAKPRSGPEPYGARERRRPGAGHLLLTVDLTCCHLSWEVEVGVTVPTSRRPDLSRSSECCPASGHMMLDGVTSRWCGRSFFCGCPPR